MNNKSDSLKTPYMAVSDFLKKFDKPGRNYLIDRALDGVSFCLESGEVLGILGESGSGKSTLATSLLGLFHANGVTVSGAVLLEGRDLLQAKPGDLQSQTAAA